jgi:hypothetical protein
MPLDVGFSGDREQRDKSQNWMQPMAQNVGGGVNPSRTIQAIACRMADRIKTMAGRGEL